MSQSIYVGNMPYTTDENELKSLFSEYGKVISVKIITDRDSGRSKGFGFVEMSEEDASKAIEGLQENELDGRKLVVNKARPQKERAG